MTAVRLAVGAGPTATLARALREGAPEDRPGLLVSYAYLAEWSRIRREARFRDWVLDSGAFSAHKSGTKIELAAYIETCKRLLATDPLLVEVFALDVIGDWRASLRNCEAMWRDGVRAIPCFHGGEPWDVLIGLARDYPKIALGGVVGWRAQPKLAWVGQCFARAWPAKIHGFGMSGVTMLRSFPFHSVDATNWEMGPCAFGQWATYGRVHGLKSHSVSLRVEVDHYLKLERETRWRWRNELARLEAMEEKR
jgi:hypothetical protein